LLKRVELAADEVELAREIPEDEPHDRIALAGIRRQLVQDEEREQEDRE
jgi:hypothetical protein